MMTSCCSCSHRLRTVAVVINVILLGMIVLYCTPLISFRPTSSLVAKQVVTGYAINTTIAPLSTSRGQKQFLDNVNFLFAYNQSTASRTISTLVVMCYGDTSRTVSFFSREFVMSCDRWSIKQSLLTIHNCDREWAFHPNFYFQFVGDIRWGSQDEDEEYTSWDV